MKSQDFKNAMAIVPTSVAVVLVGPQDRIRACTISSLVSVDVEVPQLAFVLKSESRTLLDITREDFFSISILAETQKPLALEFSNSGSEHSLLDVFGFDFHGSSQIPYLKKTPVVFFCTFKETVKLTHSRIVIAMPFSALFNNKVRPLVYQNRLFYSLSENSV